MLTQYFEYDPSEESLLGWLEKYVGYESCDFNIERLEKYFGHYNQTLKSKNCTIITVAGTNGKGECALLIEKALSRAGIESLLWTSPHILSLTERISFCGRPIDDQKLQRFFEQNKGLCEELTFYEFLFKCFCDFALELLEKGHRPVILLEVGLGGRLDATNALDANYSFLTSIGRDHIDLLGPKLSDILNEKIAVAKKGTTIFSSVEQSTLQKRIYEYAREKNIFIHNLWENKRPNRIKKEDHFQVRNRKLCDYGLKEIFSNNNAVCVNNDDQVWARPLVVTYNNSQFILIGSHNLDGLRHLTRWVAYGPLSETKIDLGLFGLSRTRDDEVRECLSLINTHKCLGVERIICDFSHPRASDWSSIEKVTLEMKERDNSRIGVEQNLQNLFSKMHSHQSVLVSGSYYFISSFLKSIPSKSIDFQDFCP